MQVIELRNYLLQPGATPEFIRFFEEHFIDSQREHGMEVLGQFEVVGEPDRFAFIRVFADMRARLRSLTGFYDSAFWQARRAKANSMLIDTDRVHLLRPLAGVDRLTADRPPGLVAVDFHRVPPGPVKDVVAQKPPALGHFVSELAPNDYPRLPVIQDPDLFVVMSASRQPHVPPFEVGLLETVLLKPTARSRMQ